MSSRVDLNNNFTKNPRLRDCSIIYNKNPTKSCKEHGKGHTIDCENLTRKHNVTQIYYTNEVQRSERRSLSNKEPASVVNFTTNPNLAANDLYANIDSNGNHITHHNYQTYHNHLTNGNHLTHCISHTNGNQQNMGNMISNCNYFRQSAYLNEGVLLPYLTDIIKELPELSINQVSEVLSSLEDDSTSGKIDTPLLDSKQVYQVLSNFNPEFIPIPFHLFQSNTLSMPKRYLKNSITDTASNTYHQDSPDKTKINHNLSPEPLNNLAKVTEFPLSTSAQNSVKDTKSQSYGPRSSVYNDIQCSINVKEKMACVNVQRGNTDSSGQKSVSCTCAVPVATKTSPSKFKTKDILKVNQSKTTPRASRIPIKVGKAKSKRKEKTHGQKGAKMSHGLKLGPEASPLETPSSKSFTIPKHYHCEKCSKTFGRLESLSGHLKLHDKNVLHVCNICNKSFQAKNHLSNHVKIHEKRKCETYSKGFKSNKKLAKQQKKHNTLRNYKCDVCEKDFTCSSHLKRHCLIHTRAKPPSSEDSCKSLSRKKKAKKLGKVNLCCKFCLKQFQVEKSFHIHVQKCVKK